MNKKILLALVGIELSIAVPASATELWETHLRGTDVGLASGALPPPGFYFVDNNNFVSFNKYNSSGNMEPNTRLYAYVNIPILLWSTGLKILGGDYAVAIAQPFDYTSIGSGYGVGTGAGNIGLFNTVIEPVAISWTFGNTHILGGIAFYLNDGSSTISDIIKGNFHNGGLPSSNGYNALEPNIAISWLKNGWNLSVSAHLTFPLDSQKQGQYNYKSGQTLLVDYTAEKTIGSWSFGLGGASQNQLGPDHLNGTRVLGSQETNYSLGPIIGYQFGKLSVTAVWLHGVYTKNDVGGDIVNVRLLTKF